MHFTLVELEFVAIEIQTLSIAPIVTVAFGDNEQEQSCVTFRSWYLNLCVFFPT